MFLSTNCFQHETFMGEASPALGLHLNYKSFRIDCKIVSLRIHQKVFCPKKYPAEERSHPSQTLPRSAVLRPCNVSPRTLNFFGEKFSHLVTIVARHLNVLYVFVDEN